MEAGGGSLSWVEQHGFPFEPVGYCCTKT